jgi:hypothetical protein
MSARFVAPDLSQLVPAKLIEEISAEAVLAAQKAWVLARWNAIRAPRPDLPALGTLGVAASVENGPSPTFWAR